MNNLVLVTGGYGFVGNNLFEYLEQYKDIRSKYKFVRFNTKHCDLRNFDRTHKLIKTLNPTHIIHLAAKCGGIGANQLAPGTFWADNLCMAVNIMECAAAYKVKKFITLGTVCSYGRNCTPPFTEDKLYTEWPEITNRPYGVAKLAIYEGLRAFNSQFEMPFSYLIPTNMYGPHDYTGTEKSHVIPAIMIKMIKAIYNNHHTVELWGDGTPTRDFLYAQDTCRALLACLDIDTGNEPINLGNNEEVSTMALAEMLAEITGYKGEIVWNIDKPNGQPRRSVDYSRAKEILSWEPRIKLYEGLKITYEWLKGYLPEKKTEFTEPQKENDEDIT